MVRSIKAWIRKKRIMLITVFGLIMIGLYIAATAGSSGVMEGDYSKERAVSFMNAMTFETGVPDNDRVSKGGLDWYKMTSHGNLQLWLEPLAGNIAIEDTDASTWWTSRPAEEEVKSAGGKGLWATNLQAPVLFEYIKQEEKGANLTAGNTLEQQAKVGWRVIEGGVGIRYVMESLGISLYVECTLTEQGFNVHLPKQGIVEESGHRLATYQVFPFLGASLNGPEGFLFVPDGPGGLIRFNSEVNAKWKPYDYPVYGTDSSAPPPEDYFTRDDIAFPVFGISRGKSGFLAVIEQGEFHADIIASPAGLQTIFNQANAQFNVRRPYYQPKGLTSKTAVFEKGRFEFASTVRYMLLKPNRTGYADMAKAYRAYLMETKGLKKLEKTGVEPPLFLNVLMAAMEKGPLGTKTVVATTFAQAQAMAENLHLAGIKNMELGFVGWNPGGLPGHIPKKLSIEAAVGGEKGLAELAGLAERLDIPVRLDQNVTYARDKFGGGYSTDDAARMITGEINKFSRIDQKLFQFNPNLIAEQYVPTITEQMKRLPINRVSLVGLGEYLYSDFNRKRYTDRESAAAAYNKALDTAKSAFVKVYTSGAKAYTLGHVDHYFGFPTEYNYDMPLSEQVPFYPIALHGLVTYSSTGGNERPQPVEGFLRDIEYGALPNYTLTHEDPRILRNTQANTLFSSQFEINRGQILDEYAGYAEAGRNVQGMFIDNHRKLAEGVFETVYEGGKTIWVNYNSTPYSADGFTVDPLSFRIVAEGRLP